MNQRKNMTIRPISINENPCKEFASCSMEELSVITGGYIFTPRGEIILIGEREEHCNVFSEYINSYLENGSSKIYDIYQATKMLCEMGCCVYSGLRYQEYISNKFGNEPLDVCTLAFPMDLSAITEQQKQLCLKLISSNQSVLGNREKIYIQYESFPGIVHTKEQVEELLKPKTSEK